MSSKSKDSLQFDQYQSTCTSLRSRHPRLRFSMNLKALLSSQSVPMLPRNAAIM